MFISHNNITINKSFYFNNHTGGSVVVSRDLLLLLFVSRVELSRVYSYRSNKQ